MKTILTLVFKCNKCNDKIRIEDPGKDTQQPFCDKCCRPMFIDKAIREIQDDVF
jgi:RNase P subunit RPR2